VYQTVKGKIVAGELHAGQFLGEESLATCVGVSRTPVREALALLERDGLVQIVPHRGAFVRWPSAKDVEDVFDIRIAVEGMALRKALPRLDEETLRSLLARLDRQAENLAGLASREVEALSVDIHMAVLRAADNERAASLIRQFREQVYKGSTLYQTPDGRLSESRVRRVIADHRELLAALLRRDLDGAAQVLARHLGNMKDMVLDTIRESGWGAVARVELE
jgi:DNA-binding GntR family transcriptional regulator